MVSCADAGIVWKAYIQHTGTFPDKKRISFQNKTLHFLHLHQTPAHLRKIRQQSYLKPALCLLSSLPSAWRFF